ncbi:MAG TPA: aconitase X catalytic domain-containing protein [Geminicoccaceae bacterium]|nr:aconitase X catalytic domain-containing protein [Geminicoccaceae bacterium]
MRLTDIEEAMARGEHGAPRQWAIQHMQQVGRAFDAADLVEVHQAHIMADTESLGEAGVAFLERLGQAPAADRRVRVPTITDPRGIDFAHYRKLGQTDAMANLERRAIDAFEALGVLMTDTCINYQTIMPPLPGEHQAYGDTGVVIYSNSVLGARSNFEGGPSALAAALTGRTPRYGLHLDENRRGTHRFVVRTRPRDLAEWGALGALVGRAAGSYWAVPVIEGIDGPPDSDALKHMGAAMASFGSIPLFHLVGITPEAPTLDAVCDPASLPVREIDAAELKSFFGEYGAPGEKVDVVVFAAPQLSLIEMQQVADLLDGRRIHEGTALLVATSPGVAADADRMRLTERIEASGALVLRGMCFYQSYAREMAEANGWRRLLTNSAKLVNILGGYGYAPSLMSMSDCVDAAVAGRTP